MQQYWEAYTEAWRLFRKFSQPTEDPEFWDELIEESKRLDKKHNTKFFRELLLATVNEIERNFENKDGKIDERQEE